MRCKVCDKRLTKEESVKKDHKGNGFLDTCSTCMGEIYYSNSQLEFDLWVDKAKEDL